MGDTPTFFAMKFLAPILACLTVAYAQRIMIGSPSAGAKLAAGQTTVVQIETPDFLSSSKEVAVAVGITSCSSSPCPSSSDTLGQLLYSGSYSPQRNLNNPTTQPFQNFRVTIPATLSKGPATLNVAHFALIGAGLEPWLETTSVSVVIR